MIKDNYLNNLKDKTIKAGVIGYPLTHTLSPKIHNFYLQKFQINGSYQALPCAPENLLSLINELKSKNYAGFNVTIPFKEKMLEICDQLDGSALEIKAVNTVVINNEKKLIGYNSDAQGFIENVFDKAKNLSLKNKNAFVIGAGGAGRAIVYALLKNNIKNIFITNRNYSKASKLIEDFAKISALQNCKIIFLDSNQFFDQLNLADILVNTTSLGMDNQPPLLLDLAKLKSTTVICDIVYKPLITNLLRQAQNNGNPIVTGLGMLIRQALVGFNLWYHKKIIDTENLEELLISNKI